MIDVLQQVLEALVSSTGELHIRLASPTDAQLLKNHRAIQELNKVIDVYNSAPPEARTEAEKTAFVFGWYKALETLKKPLAVSLFSDIISDGGMDPRNQFDKPQCFCYNCNKNKTENIIHKSIPLVLSRMIVCPECGNKRCPHATDHNLPCTGNNEPGQEGSRYERTN